MMKTWWASEPILEEVTRGLGTDLVIVFPSSVSSPKPKEYSYAKTQRRATLSFCFWENWSAEAPVSSFVAFCILLPG